MKKRKAFLCCVLSLVLLAGCGSVPTDREIINYNAASQAEPTAISGISIYLDTSAKMQDIVSAEEFSPLMYSMYSVLNDMSMQKNIPLSVSNVSDNGIEPSDPEAFTAMLKSADGYTGGNDSVVKTVFGSMSDKTLSVIFTDLGTQLEDHANVARAVIDNALSKQKAVAVIGIKTSTRPIFMIASGDNASLSEMITKFKEKPDVVEYYGKQELLQLDVTKNINYEIFAVNNGVMGIKYKDISVVENGEIYDVVKTEDENGNVDIQTNVIYEKEGSFENVNPTYTAAQLDTIEGTVNFADISDSGKRIVKNRPPKTVETTDENGETAKTEVNKDDMTYIAARSLVKDEKDGLAGKLKLEVPFDVIDGVKLSSLEFEVSPKMYITDGSQFREFTDDVNKYVKVNMAEGAIEEQGKWRVINERNSVICNLFFENAAVFPKTKGLYKLDITFKQYLDKENMPSWVTEWSENGVPELDNLFASLYEYQANKNASENTMTLYIASAKK